MSRRASLVCQHVENISRDALEKFQDVIRAYVRHRHGVYGGPLSTPVMDGSFGNLSAPQVTGLSSTSCASSPANEPPTTQ